MESPWLPGHLPQVAVGDREHPQLAEQHAGTVELVALKQGHLPGLLAAWTQKSVNNPFPGVVGCMETWRERG